MGLKVARKQNEHKVRSVPAIRWGKKLAADVAAVMVQHPDADPEDVRHTLILLRMPPWERLERSLRRGRATPVLAR